MARYRRARHCCLLYLDTSEQLSVSDYWRASTILGSVARGYVCLCVTRNSPFTSSNDHNGPIPVCLLSSYQVLLYYHTKQTRVLASEVANAISPALLQSLTFLPRPIKVLFWLSTPPHQGVVLALCVCLVVCYSVKCLLSDFYNMWAHALQSWNYTRQVAAPCNECGQAML